MWLLTLCAFLAAVTDAGADRATAFRKCCPRNRSLVKVTDGLVTEGYYECVDSESAETKYNISNFSPLILAESVDVEYGIPLCDKLQMILNFESEIDATTANDVCYDRIISEIVNGTSPQNIPKTVALICIHDETDNYYKSNLRIEHIRKCCPEGQAYDVEYHLCRDIDGESGAEWLNTWLNENVNDSYVYDIENGLVCKNEEFAVELREGLFALEVQGSALNVGGRNGRSQVPRGKWCIERDFTGPGSVGRVCTTDCSEYGAYCTKKCCPVGQHYRPLRCGSLRSICVPNTDDSVLFNISYYLDPLKADYGDLVDVLGIQIGLHCPAGKFVFNRSEATDKHWLTADGKLVGASGDPDKYCLEAFDLRACSLEDSYVTALACFMHGSIDRDFTMAVVANSISAACLAVTLLVYCALPELRNLHGRTVICHVSTMLFAYSCLARVQFSLVEDHRLCTVLGYGIYFGFVSAFVWLNVMCFDIWWTFGSIRSVQPLRKVSAERRRFLWYSLYAWGLVSLLTGAMFLLDTFDVSVYFDADIGNGMCWFGSYQNTESDWPHYIFFVIPMGVLTCINLVLWALTARHCARVKSEVHRLQAGSVGDRAKKRFRLDRAKYILTGKLWVVMGAGWFSELLSTLTDRPPWLWRVIDLINELQGLFIFLLLVFKPKVFMLIKKRLGLAKPDAQKNGMSSSTRTSSTYLSRTISADERANLRTSLPNNGVKKL